MTFLWTVSFFCGFIPFTVYFGVEPRDRHSPTDPDATWPSCSVAVKAGKYVGEKVFARALLTSRVTGKPA